MFLQSVFRLSILVILHSSLSTWVPLDACEGEKEIAYPSPQNNIDREIDALLTNAEYELFVGSFWSALGGIERAESLISLTEDSEDYRKLRVLFDKALATTCLEGPNSSALGYFEQFESLLYRTRAQTWNLCPRFFRLTKRGVRSNLPASLRRTNAQSNGKR